MKTQFVYEILNFERERDPKIVLELGLKSEISKIKDKLTEMFKEPFLKEMIIIILK